jgi:mitochondrial import receptor subunit TOM22
MVNITEDDDLDYEDIPQPESLFERIQGVCDSLPLQSMATVYNLSLDAIDTSVNIAGKIGAVGWVLATSGLLLIVPTALELEREGFVIQQETQQRVQQQQAKQVLEA